MLLHPRILSSFRTVYASDNHISCQNFRNNIYNTGFSVHVDVFDTETFEFSSYWNALLESVDEVSSQRIYRQRKCALTNAWMVYKPSLQPSWPHIVKVNDLITIQRL